jgi:phosphatidylserine synthase
MRRSVVGLQVKDVFTLVNLLGGMAAVHFALQDQLHRAGYAILLGSLIGDLFDGAVARATGTANRMGAELDSIVDHFVHVVVPGFVLYQAFADNGYEITGLVGFGALVAMATIRHARLAARRFEYPYCFCGLPRTVSGLTAMSLVLSRAFGGHMHGTHWVILGTVVLLSALNVAPVPYMTHRGARAMQPWVKTVALLMIATPILACLLARTITFDVFTVWLLGYALAGWLPIKPTERAGFRTYYDEWSHALTAPTSASAPASTSPPA